MKRLLVILSSLCVSTTSIGTVTNFVIQKDNEQKSNNYADPSEKEPEPEPNSGEGQNNDKETIVDLKTVIKNTNFDDLSIDQNDYNKYEKTILEEVKESNPKLLEEEVLIKDFITDSDFKNGTAIIYAKENSKVYFGEVKITFSIYSYEKKDFELSDYFLSMKIGDTKDVFVTNFDGATDEKNYPNNFEYDTNYFKVGYDSVRKAITISSLDNITTPPQESLKIIVRSNDKRAGNKKVISVKLLAKAKNFQLATNSISLDAIADQTVSIKITNWDDLIDSSNRPTNDKISYDKTGFVSAKVDINNKSIVFKATGNLTDKIKVTIKSLNHSEEVIVSLIRPKKVAVLEKTKIVMTTNSYEYIKVLNYDELDKQNELPDQFSYELENAVYVSFDTSNKSIQIKAKNILTKNTEIKVWSKSNPTFKQTITLTIEAENVPFKLKETNIRSQVYSTNYVQISNYPLLFDDPKNLPSKFEYDKNYADISLDIERNSIKIVTKGLECYRLEVKISSQVTSEKLYLTVYAPEIQFEIEEVKDMDSGSNQIIKVKNADSLVHKNNYPSKFTFSEDGIVDASFDITSGSIVIKSLSFNIFKRDLSMTIKSESGIFSKTVVFSVIKKQELDGMINNLGNLSDKEDETLIENFYQKNKNLGFDREIFDGLEVTNKSYKGANLSAKSDLAKKWFSNSVYVDYYVPIKNNHDSTTDWKDDPDFSNRDKATNTVSQSDSKTLDIKLSDLKQIYTKVIINLELEYKWTNEYTGKWYNNIRGNEKKNVTLKYDINNLSNELFEKIDKTYMDGGVKDEVLFFFYIGVSYSESNENKTTYRIDFKTTAQTDRYYASWASVNKILAVSKINLTSVEFEKI
ncbi:hypothetical protein SGLAD_v1c01910 [Spiroplasma gladiatoris]|uniref:Uncharacterized protein n=1 Tax=Spiroplasma gladiatoris TaxID=2143 RepID=A0A4P7AIQ5_9MOLU|nr:hypothetical protein [Spiroplasma gladiatoris]QBQ07390.1 hypothetical protein SGLAD_v1c01910 [Spiroplasma gladiatoris]